MFSNRELFLPKQNIKCKIRMIYLDIPNFIFSLSSPLSAANSLESFSLLGEVQKENKVPIQSKPIANAKKSLFFCQNCPNIPMELIIWSQKEFNNITFNEHCNLEYWDELRNNYTLNWDLLWKLELNKCTSSVVVEMTKEKILFIMFPVKRNKACCYFP